MRRGSIWIFTLAAWVVLLAPGARAQQTPIAGQSVLGDKSRSGPDGWSWAPIARDQAAAGKAPGQTDATVKAALNAQPGGDHGTNLPPGADPGTPARTDASGPGTLDAPAASTPQSSTPKH